jgi:hypothetical protein
MRAFLGWDQVEEKDLLGNPVLGGSKAPTGSPRKFMMPLESYRFVTAV